MATRRIGIAINGATGRIGRTQHLARALGPMRAAGGLALADGTALMPEPILVGRDAGRLRALAGETGVERWSTDLDAVLGDAAWPIYFDCAVTAGRADRLAAAIAAGKHVYSEKPLAGSRAEAAAVVAAAEAAGVRHGIVCDKIFLPGLRKLRGLVDAGFFGRLLSVRAEFGWWVFSGDDRPAQRPSWNYRKARGGGLLLDMTPHWRYILEHVFAPVTGVFCRTATHVPQRRDEAGNRYRVDVEDTADMLLALAGGVTVTLTTSWARRVRRSDLLTIQADGTGGSAVATLHDCWVQPHAATPLPVFSTEARQPADFFADWRALPDEPFHSSFRSCWDRFLPHVAADAPFDFPMQVGVRGLELIDAAYESAATGRWIDLPADGRGPPAATGGR